MSRWSWYHRPIQTNSLPTRNIQKNNRATLSPHLTEVNNLSSRHQIQITEMQSGCTKGSKTSKQSHSRGTAKMPTQQPTASNACGTARKEPPAGSPPCQSQSTALLYTKAPSEMPCACDMAGVLRTCHQPVSVVNLSLLNTQ